MIDYISRLQLPELNNPYYNTKSNGGYSSAIQGKCRSTGKPYKGLNVLANCVGYAYGRFHEEINDPKMSYLTPVNAELFPEYAKNLKFGLQPKLGSIMVWKKGTLDSSDGAGHVAVVEQILSDGSVVVSESGYNSSPFWTARHICGDDQQWLLGDDYYWMKSKYQFRCFIYPPVEFNEVITPRTLKKGDTGKDVGELQENLNRIGAYKLTVDCSFGNATENAVKDFQKKNGLSVDGVVGPATHQAIQKALKDIIKPADVFDLTFLLDGNEVTSWAMNAGDQNYIRMADLQNLGIVKSVKWNSEKKIVEVKTK